MAPDRVASEHEDGLGLVELMIAVLMLAVGVMALVSVSTFSLTSVTSSSQRQQATALVTASLERALTYDYDALAMDVSVPECAAPVIDLRDDGSLEEAPVCSDPGPVDTARPHGGTDDAITLQTFITWVEDRDSTGPVTQAAKRVTVEARWQVAGDAQVLRSGTVVSEVTNG